MESKDTIKALEYRAKASCEVCDIKDKFCCENCHVTLMKDALDLIKTDKQKITELEAECVKVNFAYIGAKALYSKIKAGLEIAEIEAYKEYTRKLLALIGSVELSNLDLRRHINNLTNELIERKEHK